jgi:hypothetical protein
MRDTEITGKNEEASTRTMVGKDLPQSPWGTREENSPMTISYVR